MTEFFRKRTANAKNDILSGITVALALVPEAVAFAFVAGVDPLVGLYAAFMIGLITSIFGGRPGMISGATGALAVVMVSLVAEGNAMGEASEQLVLVLGMFCLQNIYALPNAPYHEFAWLLYRHPYFLNQTCCRLIYHHGILEFDVILYLLYRAVFCGSNL